jgi:xanthine dehydrogenase small subunit
VSTWPAVRLPRHAEHAAKLLAEPGTRVVAGGTLEIPSWRRGAAPAVAVCLTAIPALGEAGDTWCGAAVPLARLASSRSAPAALRLAAASIGGPALRESATVGGNVTGRSPGCLTVPLLALDAVAEVCDHDGLREWLPLARWGPGQPHLLTSVRWSAVSRSAFAKVATRAAGGTVLGSAAAARARAGSHRGAREVVRVAVAGQGAPPALIVERSEPGADLNAAIDAALAGRAAEYTRELMRTLARRVAAEVTS